MVKPNKRYRGYIKNRERVSMNQQEKQIIFKEKD
jgi:hypothetical protein